MCRLRRRDRLPGPARVPGLLDAPIERVTSDDVPMPYALNLEREVIPQVADVVAAVKRASVPGPSESRRNGADHRTAEAVPHDGRGRPRPVDQEGRRQGVARRPRRRGRDRQGEHGVQPRGRGRAAEAPRQGGRHGQARRAGRDPRRGRRGRRRAGRAQARRGGRPRRQAKPAAAAGRKRRAAARPPAASGPPERAAADARPPATPTRGRRATGAARAARRPARGQAGPRRRQRAPRRPACSPRRWPRRSRSSSASICATSRGTGPGGRIVERDVREAADGGARRHASAAAARARPRRTTRRREPTAGDARRQAGARGARPRAARAARPTTSTTTGRCRTCARPIAARLTEAKRDVPHFYLTAPARRGAAAGVPPAAQRAARRPRQGLASTTSSSRRAALALRRVPECNAPSWATRSATTTRVHIGVAVALERGPGHAGRARRRPEGHRRRSAPRSRDLAERAKQRAAQGPRDHRARPSRVSNLGMFGIEQFDARSSTRPRPASSRSARIVEAPVVERRRDRRRQAA